MNKKFNKINECLLFFLSFLGIESNFELNFELNFD